MMRTNKIKLLLILAVLAASLGSIGAVYSFAVNPASASKTDPNGETVIVQPLSAEEQLAIDQGLTYKESSAERPTTYKMGNGKHCVIWVEPIQAREKMSGGTRFECYDNFSDALAAATGGKLHVSKDFRPDDVTQQMLDDARGDAPTTDTVIGLNYVDANYQGTTLTWATSYTPGCTDGTTFGKNVHSSWNDIISSAYGYQGCNMNHYEHINYGGSMLACRPNCSSMGAMNDQTSSVNFVP